MRLHLDGLQLPPTSVFFLLVVGRLEVQFGILTDVVNQASCRLHGLCLCTLSTVYNMNHGEEPAHISEQRMDALDCLSFQTEPSSRIPGIWAVPKERRVAFHR